MMTENNGMNQAVREVVNVEMSKDKMLGVMWFEEPKNGGNRLSENDIRAAISTKGIAAGLDEELINTICKERQYNYKYIIAKGKAAVDGSDGSIEFKFDTASLKEFKPRLNDDGTVDFRNLDVVRNVKKGDILAVKIPATQGEDGFNIIGQNIKAKKGKEARIPKGRNTAILEDGLTLVADVDGKLEYDDHNVYINTVYTLNGDLDSGIGNIDFVGSVVINGNVHSGFRIKAGGSVEIRGSVDDATIIAGGNVFLSYGMQGTERSKIIAGGNVVAKFLQNVQVEADGNVITEAILHSKVNAGDSIKVETGKGTIVGGSVSATNMIIARSIGSPMGTVTAIQIGVSPTIYKEHKEIGEELKRKTENLNKIDQSIKFLLEKNKVTKLDVQKQAMLQKLTSSRQPLVEEYEELKAKYTKLGIRLSEVKEGLIKATDSVYPGVKVEIGSLIKYIDDRYVRCVIRRVEGEIYIGI